MDTPTIRETTYFVFDENAKIWTARLPFGRGWRLYANDPIIQSLSAWTGRIFWLFAAFATAAFVAGWFQPVAPYPALLAAFLIGGLGWSLSATLDATIMHVETGVDQRDFGPLTEERKLFLKTQTTRLAFLVTAAGVMGVGVGQAMLS